MMSPSLFKSFSSAKGSVNKFIYIAVSYSGLRVHSLSPGQFQPRFLALLCTCYVHTYHYIVSLIITVP